MKQANKKTRLLGWNEGFRISRMVESLERLVVYGVAAEGEQPHLTVSLLVAVQVSRPVFNYVLIIVCCED